MRYLVLVLVCLLSGLRCAAPTAVPAPKPVVVTGAVGKPAESAKEPATQGAAAAEDDQPAPVLVLVEKEGGEILRVNAAKRRITGMDFALEDCMISKGSFAGSGKVDGKTLTVSGKLEDGAYTVTFISGSGRGRMKRVVVMVPQQAQ